jgi:hypothetical protein
MSTNSLNSFFILHNEEGERLPGPTTPSTKARSHYRAVGKEVRNTVFILGPATLEKKGVITSNILILKLRLKIKHQVLLLITEFAATKMPCRS